MTATSSPRKSTVEMSISTIVEHHDYQDEAGHLLYQAVRAEPKSVFQRRPDGEGGWIDNLEGVRRIPFHLRALIADRARNVVYVLESEKDVLSLHKRGLTATTSAGGAAWKWPDEWAEYFKGATRVVVIADNDKAGVEAAYQRAGVIARVCHDVRVIEALPGVPDKGDVSDWLAIEGNTKDRLEALAAKVPKFSPLPSPLQQQKAPSESVTVMEQWGALLRRVVDDGRLDGHLSFAGEWRTDGTRPIRCPFANEHQGLEETNPSASLITQKGSGLRCHNENHKRGVLGLLRDIGWANDTDAARRKLTALGYTLPASRPLQIVTLSDIEELPMQWLWDGRIAYNCLTILAGDGGIGKSYVTIATAAAVTRGGKLPVDGGMQDVEQGDVLLVGFEDGVGIAIAQVIKKRARLCDVDDTNLHVIEGARDEKGKIVPFSRVHVDLIAAHLRENPGVRLVIIDPLISYIGKADAYRDNDVREALHGIVDVIQKCPNKVALLIVHPNHKAAGEKSTDRVAGSVGLTNLARSVIAADYEKLRDEKTGEERNGRKMLTVVKGNDFGKTSPIPFGINDDGTFWWSKV
jgi:hypothetical protein